MPIYAFACNACGHSFDKLQKLSDPDPAACPSCGEARVKRQLTAPAFRLAGSGWYETDFKKDGDRKRNLVEGGEGAGKTAETAASGDGKAATAATPAAKSEPAPAKAEPKPAASARKAAD